jgi:hypothetical protein
MATERRQSLRLSKRSAIWQDTDLRVCDVAGAACFSGECFLARFCIMSSY